MKVTIRRTAEIFIGSVLALLICSGLQAMQRGGRGGGAALGGARPSMGNVGGGGGRPSMGGGMSMPQVSRPSVPNNLGNRPSMGNVQRPTAPMTRPAMPSLPSANSRPSGGFNPSGGGRPNITLPSTGNNQSSRPTTKLPGNLGPTTRPSLPGNINPGGGNLGTGNVGGGANRPTTLPGNVDRPSLGNINRPTTPGTRPGTLPGVVEKPGAITLPGTTVGGGTNRPQTLPGKLPGTLPGTLPGNLTRPGTGNERPGIGAGNRPIINNPNRPTDRPTTLPGSIDRPNINVNRPGSGNNSNNNVINIGNNNLINTRPAWQNPNWNRPDWGWGGGHSGWADDWHNNCVHHHHNWYNGCWNQGYWGSSWYVPVAWGVAGWGLGTWTSSWGYGTAYYNPYYSVPATSVSVPYDYSQSVSINNYISSTAPVEGNPTSQSPAPEADGLSVFDQGLVAFKAGKYVESLNSFDRALKTLPNDPVVHEVRALNLFALGQFPSAAASLNSLLSSAPGMDWTTMSGLYGEVSDYSSQLKKLEQFCQTSPNDAAAHFVLAYHRLVLGAEGDAVAALKVVVKNEPKDSTARRMLDALSPSTQASGEPNPTNSEGAQFSTDLVGSWRATPGETTIELTISEDSQFVWKASSVGKTTAELQGNLTSEDDALVLVNDKQGSMAGSVKSLGPDSWQFKLVGSPAADSGLRFERLKK